ncbi:MAG TPA: hypothetical protein VN848_02005 [Gemmatimonadales bacterium]|nr:hypothetical protein [Gemmatimonadales bacterium]
MSGHVLCGIGVLLGLLAAGRGVAQVPRHGERLRIVLAGIHDVAVVGYVEAFNDDTLRLGVSELPSAGSARAFAWWRVIAVPVPAIESIAVSHGRYATPGRDRLVGAVLGATFGTAMGLASGNDPASAKGVFAMSAPVKAAYGALGFGALGMGLAEWLGHVGVGPERWVPIILPPGQAAPGAPRVVAVGISFVLEHPR